MKSKVVSGGGESFRGARVVSGAVAFFDGWFRGIGSFLGIGIDFAVCAARASVPAGNTLQGAGGGGTDGVGDILVAGIGA